MTDREKKQREILEKCVVSAYNIGKNELPYERTKKWIDQALAELNAIPTSKEVEEAVKLTKTLSKLMLETDWGGVSVTKGAFRNALQTLIQAVTHKEEVGVEEVEETILENSEDNGGCGVAVNSKTLAKSLLTNYSIRRRNENC